MALQIVLFATFSPPFLCSVSSLIVFFTTFVQPGCHYLPRFVSFYRFLPPLFFYTAFTDHVSSLATIYHLVLPPLHLLSSYLPPRPSRYRFFCHLFLHILSPLPLSLNQSDCYCFLKPPFKRFQEIS